MITNEESWGDVERLPFFNAPDTPTRLRAWDWLEKLQRGRGLTQLQIMQLIGLLESVHKMGKEEER